jgi:hypothetical protein
MANVLTDEKKHVPRQNLIRAENGVIPMIEF